MLLAIDTGNTHTVIGLIENKAVKKYWRLPTNKQTTPDEMYIDLSNLLKSKKLSKEIDGFCFCSVVPEVSHSLSYFGKKLDVKTLNLDDIKTDVINIKYDTPDSVGADRIANAVAVKEGYGAPAIVVDYGTATTFDVISESGDYLGGAISPGVETSINGLFDKAAQLHNIRLEKAEKAVGMNTKDSISAGFILGLAGMTDFLIEKISEELGYKFNVISTGGFSGLISPYCNKIEKVDKFLTLKGLEIVFEKN